MNAIDKQEQERRDIEERRELEGTARGAGKALATEVKRFTWAVRGSAAD
jgi:hypothetical protein